jgi:RimJ/RimL family protein N-acetyltransferase
LSSADSLRTPRLLLRRWRDDDLAPFAALNADPVVMEHFPAPLDRAQSDALVTHIESGFDRDGFGLWAVEGAEEPLAGRLLGFVGLMVAEGFRFSPTVEVGWRLARTAWGRGYATEAAVAAIDSGRGLGVGEVVSFTAQVNARSQRVMQRLGMVRDPADDFDHPRLAEDSPLRRHVLYRLPAGVAPRRR